MQKKSNVSTAMWFIPLLAILLASAFIFIYWVGRVLFLSPSSTQPVASQKNPLQNSATQNDTSIPMERNVVLLMRLLSEITNNILI